MKPIFLLLIGLTLWCSEALAQSDLDEQQVLKTHDALDQALINRDSIALSALTAENLTYGHSSGLIQDKDEFLADVLHGPFKFDMITNEDRQLVLSGNTAIVRFILDSKATRAGKPDHVRIGVMMVFMNNGQGKVELVARQAYKL